jgi:hypothetical protein
MRPGSDFFNDDDYLWAADVIALYALAIQTLPVRYLEGGCLVKAQKNSSSVWPQVHPCVPAYFFKVSSGQQIEANTYFAPAYQTGGCGFDARHSRRFFTGCRRLVVCLYKNFKP